MSTEERLLIGVFKCLFVRLCLVWTVPSGVDCALSAMSLTKTGQTVSHSDCVSGQTVLC